MAGGKSWPEVRKSHSHFFQEVSRAETFTLAAWSV